MSKQTNKVKANQKADNKPSLVQESAAKALKEYNKIFNEQRPVLISKSPRTWVCKKSKKSKR